MAEPGQAAASGIERVKARWSGDPYLRLLGVELEAVEAGYARIAMPLTEQVLNGGHGVLHGGVICTLIDCAIGIALNSATWTSDEGPLGQTTTDLNVSFLAGARKGPVIAEAKLIRRGGTLAVGEATVTDGAGATVAVGRATFMIIRPGGRVAGS